MQVATKAARAELAASQRKHKQLWSVQNIKALGDQLHTAIQANAPITGHRVQYCGVILEVCKQNQCLSIERQRRRKRGEDVNTLPPLQEAWPAFANLNRFGTTTQGYMSGVRGPQQYGSSPL